MGVALVLTALGLVLLKVPAPRADPDVDGAQGTSVLATWDCTGTPCPWDGGTTGQAAVWPAAAEPVRTRNVYTVSDDVYATASKVAGWRVRVTAGEATLYAVSPAGSHMSLAALRAGQDYTVPANLGTDAVVSLQSDARFDYTITPSAPLAADPASRTSSVRATWECTSAPCPWGKEATARAAVWPLAVEPVRKRYGYTVSDDVYAPASKAAGWKVTVSTGEATVYYGTPTGSEVPLAVLRAGQHYTVPTSLGSDDVVSVQSGAAFDYTLVSSTRAPGAAPAAPCTDPRRCDPVSWVPSTWRYDGKGKDPGDWRGGVITWPSWSAFSSNDRTGKDSRTVYSESGARLYPYMGAWAEGCKITVVSGRILVIEWERGSNDWRETKVSTGRTHTIKLVGKENGAMIETPNNSQPFQVRLSSCTPRRIDKGSSR